MQQSYDRNSRVKQSEKYQHDRAIGVEKYFAFSLLHFNAAKRDKFYAT